MAAASRRSVGGSASQSAPRAPLSQRRETRKPLCRKRKKYIMAGLVQLELNDDDKENFSALQAEMAKAQQELSMTTQKLRTRNAEGKSSSVGGSEPVCVLI